MCRPSYTLRVLKKKTRRATVPVKRAEGTELLVLPAAWANCHGRYLGHRMVKPPAPGRTSIVRVVCYSTTNTGCAGVQDVCMRRPKGAGNPCDDKRPDTPKVQSRTRCKSPSLWRQDPQCRWLAVHGCAPGAGGPEGERNGTVSTRKRRECGSGRCAIWRGRSHDAHDSLRVIGANTCRQQQSVSEHRRRHIGRHDRMA